MNRLSDQTSPYLLRHANNPVEWQPWDDEALAQARRENKPILLSIGYAASHLCQVMARESFESSQVAVLMNDRFVNILVDREERPDLDRIYQVAHGLLNRKPGGWPLTMILDPHDHLPFFGGTYFPPQPRQQTPSFREVLKGIAKMYGTKNSQMDEFKTKLAHALGQVLGGGTPADIDGTLVDRACGQIDASFDAQHGGFSEAPKFPHPAGLELLLDAAACADSEAKSERAQHMLDFTLSAMACGGLFDHVGGGFHRDSTDAEWTIPHFEKMLYDNALLLSLYARYGRRNATPHFQQVANQTADWLMREMQLDSGGICGSLAADSDGAEGRFYVWSVEEMQTVLGEDYATAAEHFGLNDKANFADSWHLRLAAPRPSATDHSAQSAIDLSNARTLLFNARETRIRPARDGKILTAWNALSIRGLADIGQHLGRADCVDAATRVVDYLHSSHWQDGRLSATGHSKLGLDAYLDDYAFLLDGLLVLLAARWRDGDLTFAIQLADALIERFEDPLHGGFFFTSHDHQALLQRTKAFGDDALPAGNAVAIRSLFELGFLLGQSRYVDTAERALRAGMTDAGRWPSAHATLMRAVLDHKQPPPRVLLRCAESDATPWRDAADKFSARSRCYVIPAGAALPGLLGSRSSMNDASVTAHVYCASTCAAPVTSLGEFADVLQNTRGGTT